MKASIVDHGLHLEAGEGVPVVMLPGMEGSRFFWEHQVEELGGKYRAVSFDLPVRRPGLSRRVSEYAREILDRMDVLGIEKAVFIGESTGGVITQEVLATDPERVLAAVLCNTMDRPGRGGFGLNVFTIATLVHQLAFLPFLSDGQRRRLFAWVGRHRGFVMDPTPGNADLIEYLFEHGLECGGGAYVDRMIALSKARYTSRLSDVNVPVLVLRGTEDRLVGPETALRLAGGIRGAEVALVEGGGHCCPHTMPAETNRLIIEWLERKGL